MKYYLTIFSMFRNEKIYLKEWIDFHLNIGFEHIYLYDNLSTDNPLEILEEYISKNKVTYIKWDINYPKFTAREHFFKNYNNETYWCAFLDIDEFLFCVDPNDKIIEKIKDYEKFPGLAINWYCYGDSGEEHYKNKYVIERFIKRAEKEYHINFHTKQIAKVNNILACENPHYFIYKYKEYAVNENKGRIEGAFTDKVYGDIFRINHYHSKSKEEFFNIKHNKNEANRSIASLDYYNSYNTDSNLIEDKILHRYLEEIKNAN